LVDRHFLFLFNARFYMQKVPFFFFSGSFFPSEHSECVLFYSIKEKHFLKPQMVREFFFSLHSLERYNRHRLSFAMHSLAYGQYALNAHFLAALLAHSVRMNALLLALGARLHQAARAQLFVTFFAENHVAGTLDRRGRRPLRRRLRRRLALSGQHRPLKIWLKLWLLLLFRLHRHLLLMLLTALDFLLVRDLDQRSSSLRVRTRAHPGRVGVLPRLHHLVKLAQREHGVVVAQRRRRVNIVLMGIKP